MVRMVRCKYHRYFEDVSPKLVGDMDRNSFPRLRSAALEPLRLLARSISKSSYDVAGTTQLGHEVPLEEIPLDGL